MTSDRLDWPWKPSSSYLLDVQFATSTVQIPDIYLGSSAIAWSRKNTWVDICRLADRCSLKLSVLTNEHCLSVHVGYKHAYDCRMATLNLSTNGPSISKSYQSIVSSPSPSGNAAQSPTYGQWAVFSVSAPLVNAFQQDTGGGGKESILKVQSTGGKWSAYVC